MIEQDTVVYAALVESPEAASAVISATAAAPNAAAPQRISLLELLTELARRKALVAKVTIAAMAIAIAFSVIEKRYYR